MFRTFPRFLAALTLSMALVVSLALTPTDARVATRGAAVDFSLKSVEGGNITSEMLRGDVVVLAFGASWLQLPRAQVQGVQHVADEFAERDVRVYWVSTDSDKPQSKNYATDEQLRTLARKNGLKVAVLRDPDGAFFKKTGADQIPSVIILDREGRVSGTPVGGISTNPKNSLVNTLSGRLNTLLSEQ